MSFLSPTQKQTLLNLLTANGLVATEENGASNLLNSPTTPANQVAPQELVRVDFGTLLTGLATTSLVAINNSQLAQHFVDMIGTQDRAALATLISFWGTMGVISSAEATAMSTKINQTVAQAGWTPVTNGPSVFASAFPGAVFVINGFTYMERCHPALIVEARI